MHTIKDHGVKYMEENRESYHAGGPYNPGTGEYVRRSKGGETYNSNQPKIYYRFR